HCHDCSVRCAGGRGCGGCPRCDHGRGGAGGRADEAARAWRDLARICHLVDDAWLATCAVGYWLPTKRGGYGWAYLLYRRPDAPARSGAAARVPGRDGGAASALAD